MNRLVFLGKDGPQATVCHWFWVNGESYVCVGMVNQPMSVYCAPLKFPQVFFFVCKLTSICLYNFIIQYIERKMNPRPIFIQCKVLLLLWLFLTVYNCLCPTLQCTMTQALLICLWILLCPASCVKSVIGSGCWQMIGDNFFGLFVCTYCTM